MPTIEPARSSSSVPQIGGDEIFTPARRRQVSRPGLRTFVALANLWDLTEEQRLRMLGSPSRSTYYNWVKAVQQHREITLDFDILVRISAVLDIWSALRILHETEAEGIAWLRGPHRELVFGGRAPLEVMASGTQDALLTTRRFLDAARGGLYMEPNQVDENFEPYRDEDVVWS
ncbi:MbcA/ParS/Xre antitoxin family protein [Azorhizobium sp. AG788]|uniref:MbcA/ParS/Xre antitoxin family protein n=1 Tax=Azorhizobium sp. AG788 TaxID=2183897 RepID=UPI0031389AD8